MLIISVIVKLSVSSKLNFLEEILEYLYCIKNEINLKGLNTSVARVVFSVSQNSRRPLYEKVHIWQIF